LYPFNEAAVKQLIKIKNRSPDKSFILIAANWQQIESLVQKIPAPILKEIHATWPGPITWIFPASANVPSWLRNKDNTIALRVTAHPIAKSLCEIFGKPIISTSANLEGETSARDAETVIKIFGEKIDLIIPGKTGGLAKPSEIRDVITGKTLR
jgi:L-threonylcarbamoyladenylate synthase